VLMTETKASRMPGKCSTTKPNVSATTDWINSISFFLYCLYSIEEM
jgi:hypothetical protein